MTDRRLQSGFALAEALVALLILALGLLALMQMQSQLAQHSAFAREQASAALWAQQKLEQLRATPQAEGQGQDEPQPGQQRRWQRLETQVGTSLQAHVQWVGRDGQTHEVQLHSILARQDAEQATLLMSPPPEVPLGAEGRPVALPPQAQRLVNSHWHRLHQPGLPGEGGSWLVFDGRTGDVAFRCTTPPPNEAALTACLAVATRFLHGSVERQGDFSLRAVSVQLDRGGAVFCTLEPVVGAQRFSCLVPVVDHDQILRTPMSWSGRLQWSVSADVTVCRYAHNASSVEGHYTDVAHTLFHQNHVLSTQGCPPGTQPQ